MKLLTLQIASLPDRKNLVAEIWLENNQVAEVSNECNGCMRIEIFPAPDCGIWAFELSELQSVLAEAISYLQKK